MLKSSYSPNFCGIYPIFVDNSSFCAAGFSPSGESVASSGQFIEEIISRDTSGMTTLASVDETTSLTSGTYSISTADELSKLATMTNNGLIGENTEFVLANDIDLSAYSTGEGWTPIGSPSKSFTATFDGNGYVISNLYINTPSINCVGGHVGYCVV